MSGAALGWAKAQKAPNMIAKAVLICLADYADDQGTAWPSVPKLAAEVQVSDRTVQRSLRALEEAGLLTVEKHDRKDGGQTSNRYHLAFTPGDCVSPPRCQPVTPPVTLLSPANGTPIELSPSDEGERTRKPKAKTRATYPADFEACWKAYPHHEGRSSKPNALTQWRALPPDERAALPGALARFRLKVADVCGGKGAPDMARWLRDGKHLAWQEAAAGPSSAAPATFNAPAVRASIVKAQDEDFARRWIDHYCRWEPDDRRLTARTSSVASRLQRDLAEWASANRVTIEVATANDEAEPQRERVA